MEEPDEDWEIEEQSTCEYLEGGGGGKGNVRWILEKGMDLGKKAVITGFVMSSAPVVLPPILVVSAVGFAFSVPFGLVFTGYACTQKLMGALLPMSTESPMLEYDQMFYDEIEGVGERGEEGKYQIDMEKEENEQRDYLRAGVEERIELVKNENEMPQTDEEGRDVGREEIDLKIGETEPVRKDDKYGEVKPEGDRVVANTILKKQNTEEEDIRRGSVSLLEKIKDEGNADDAAKKTKKKRNKNKKTTSKGSAEMPLPDVKDHSVISKNQKSGPEKNSVATSRPEATDGDDSSEVNEEKIWEQIDALRMIVGYKSTPHRSSFEEVKALYVFAGVDLPPSSGGQPDLAQLSNKIRFLMSVVGVK